MSIRPRRKALPERERETRNVKIVMNIDPITNVTFPPWSDKELRQAEYLRIPYRIYNLYPFYLVKDFITDFFIGEFDGRSVDFIRELDIYIEDFVAINDRYLEFKIISEKKDEGHVMEYDGRKIYVNKSLDITPNINPMCVSQGLLNPIEGDSFVFTENSAFNCDKDFDLNLSSNLFGKEDGDTPSSFDFIKVPVEDDSGLSSGDSLDSLKGLAYDSEICNFLFDDSSFRIDDVCIDGGNVIRIDNFENSIHIRDEKNPYEPKMVESITPLESKIFDKYSVRNYDECSIKEREPDVLGILTNHDKEDFDILRKVVGWNDALDLLIGSVPYFVTQQGVNSMRDYLYTYPHKILWKDRGVKGLGEYILDDCQKYDKRDLIEHLTRIYVFRNVFRDEVVIGTFSDDFALDSHLMGKVVSYLKQPLVYLDIEKDILLNRDFWIRKFFLDPGDIDFSQEFQEILSRYEVCYQLLLLEGMRAIELSERDKCLVKETLFYLLSLCSNWMLMIKRDLGRAIDKDKLYFIILQRLNRFQLLNLYRKDDIGTYYSDYILTFLELKLCLNITGSCIDYLVGIGPLNIIF
jgi:hypothetical protein